MALDRAFWGVYKLIERLEENPEVKDDDLSDRELHALKRVNVNFKKHGRNIDTLKTLKTKLWRTRSFEDNSTGKLKTINIECGGCWCIGNTAGYYSKLNDPDRIHLCGPLWEEPGTWKQQFIHELTHGGADTEDHAYNGTDEYDDLSVEEHLENADTIATFVKDWVGRVEEKEGK